MDILLVLSFIAFVVAALRPVGVPFDLTATGLALLVASMLF